MSPGKILPLLPGALLLLLSCFHVLVLGELSQDFAKCSQFFYKETPPQGVSGAGYQPICQRYKNQYHFATMYQRQHRAPLYSAYKLGIADGKRPDATWKYEPQLAFSRADPEMQPFNFSIIVDQNVIESQAVLRDYKNSNYTRGHINPSMHMQTREGREATFTLTNIVPQRAGSNGGPWSRLELDTVKKFKAYCQGPMYVITGAMPYESEARWINNRVSVPEYMWSAYCCPSYKADLPKYVEMFFPTYAAVGRNDRNSSEEIVPVNRKTKDAVRGYDVRRMPLDDLERILSQRLGNNITLFDGQCQ